MREEQYIHVNQNGDKFYYADNKMVVYHRTDGPAAEYACGTKKWYVNGVLHHTDGPAIEWANGDKVWYVNGLRHRVDGPAVEYADGDKEWYANGELHRTDGPAIEYASGTKKWYVNGVKHTEKEFEKITSSQPQKVHPCLSFTLGELETKVREWSAKRNVITDDGEIHPQSSVEHGKLMSFVRGLFVAENS